MDRICKSLRSPKDDPQAAQVYRMERELDGASRCHSAPTDYLSRVLTRSCRMYRLREPKLVIRRLHKMYGECDDRAIRLNADAGLYCGANVLTLIHETAHHVANNLTDDSLTHNKWWAGIYGYLLAKFRLLPPDAYDAMARRWGIKRARPELCSPRALRASARRKGVI